MKQFLRELEPAQRDPVLQGYRKQFGLADDVKVLGHIDTKAHIDYLKLQFS